MSNIDCKKPQAEYDFLKEEISQANESIHVLTTLKHLYVNKNEKKFSKNLMKKCKKIIATNTKKLKQIDKDYKNCLKNQNKTKRTRCPNGTRKNKSTGKCENK